MPSKPPRIVFFPEASFGSALNCVGIAQDVTRQGGEAVFLTLEGFEGVYADYGFREYAIPVDSPVSADAAYENWQGFLNRHLPHFNLSPEAQIDTYVRPVWQAIVDTVIRSEKGLAGLLTQIAPDVIVLDNVVMFPAIATYGCPWVRIISCAETELPDPNVPPYLSGLTPKDGADCATFSAAYDAALEPVHAAYNRFRRAAGLAPLAPTLFLETSPVLNMLLSPELVRYGRAAPLPPGRFTYLDGCVRREQPYEVPVLPRNDGPLIYVSFGSLGAADTALFKRLLDVFGTVPARFLVNVGAQIDAYENVPDNVHLSEWFPQPSVVQQCDLFIHHGGNNSFCEALYFGVPSLIMPYCWDGHDNATRAVEQGAGLRLRRADWTGEALRANIMHLLENRPMKTRLHTNAERMQAAGGVSLAAEKLLQVVQG